MGVDEIITLDDNREFILVAKTIIDGKSYFMATEAVDGAPSDNYELFKEIDEDGDIIVETVEDLELRTKILDSFEDQFDILDEQED